MLDLTRQTELHVQQITEPIEIFIGFEGRNMYTVEGREGQPILHAGEASGFLNRQFMGGHRSLTVQFRDTEGKDVMAARRPFYWFLSRMEVRTVDGAMLGAVQRRCAFFTRKYDVLGPNGEHLLEVKGPVFRPNTFFITRGGQEYARIVKRWGGVLREAFTKADRFQIEYTAPPSSREAALLLPALAIVLDLDFFEERQNRNSGFHVSTSMRR